MTDLKMPKSKSGSPASQPPAVEHEKALAVERLSKKQARVGQTVRGGKT